MSRLYPLALALALAGCRFDTRGLAAADASLERASDRSPPTEASDGPRELADGATLDRGARDLAPDLPSPPLVPPPYLASKDGWGQRLPLVESGENLNGLWLSPAGPAWAVGDGGRILHSAAFGRDWRIVDLPVAVDLRAVAASSPADVWIVGSSGTALHYDGQTLAAVSLPTTEDLHAVFAFSPGDVWIAGNANTLLHYDGASWTPLTPPTAPSTSLRGIWGASPSEVWVVGSGGTILRYVSGVGSKLTSGTSFQLNAVWGSGAKDLWSVGTGGTILRYDGASWSAVPSSTGASLVALHGTPAGEVLAVGATGTVVRYSGGSWKPETLPDTFASLHAIAGSSAGNVLVAGASATLRRFDGSSWSKLALRPSTALNAVLSVGGEVWAVGNSGLVLRSGTGGWQVVDPPSTTTDLRALWATSPAEVWVAGGLGLVARWSSATKTWTKTTTGTASTLNGLWGRSASDLWAVGSLGTVLRHDGTSWSAPSLGYGGTFHAVHGNSAQIVIGGSSSRVVSFDGTTWSMIDLLANTNYRAAWCDAAGEAWLVGDGGSLVYTDGAGYTLKAYGTNLLGLFGVSPTQLWAVGDAGVILAIGGGLGSTPHESDTTANLAAIHGTSATDLWAVGSAATILHHDDRLP